MPYRAILLLAAAALLAGCAQPRAAYDIPRLGGVTVDGQAEDWDDGGFRVEAMARKGEVAPPDDLLPTARIGWDEQGLLLLVQVTDDIAAEHESQDRLWARDSVEIFVSAGVGSPVRYQLVASSGADATRGGKLRQRFYEFRQGADSLPKLTAEVASTTSGASYVIEARLPWSNLAAEPEPGGTVGFQLFVNDSDDAPGKDKALWFPRDHGGHKDLNAMYALRLAGHASPPVTAAAMAGFHRQSRSRLDVLAVPEAAGQTAELRRGGKTLAKAKLTAEAGWATGTLDFPLPPPGRPYGPLVLHVGGKPTAIVDLPDADAMRARAFAEAELRFTPVFTGEALPEIDFRCPGWAEQLSGGYEIEATYFGTDGGKVTHAERPGRYGARVVITPKRGEVIEEHITLYRAPRGIRWWEWEWTDFAGTLPAGLGVSPDVARARREDIAEAMKWLLSEATDRNAHIASLIADLSERAAGDTLVCQRSNAYASHAKWWYEVGKRHGFRKPLRYAAHLPEGYDSDTARRYPLILFLHGAGERGDNIELAGKHGVPDILKHTEDHLAIVLWPQCPKGRWWGDYAYDLADLLAAFQKEYRVDADRVYVTGLSMGGYGSWTLAAHFPDRFAAVAPICGGGDPRDAARLTDVPVWAFHGAKDGTVPLRRSEEMVEAIRAAGGKRVSLTVYPEAGHNSWSATYADPRLYEWLFSNIRHGLKRNPPSTQPAMPK